MRIQVEHVPWKLWKETRGELAGYSPLRNATNVFFRASSKTISDPYIIRLLVRLTYMLFITF